MNVSIAALPILTFDPKTEEENLLRASHEFQMILGKERLPDDPVTPYEHHVASLRNIPPFVDVRIWHIHLPDGRIVAAGDVGMLKTPENAHLAQFHISVLPEFRRRGLATRLLHEVLTVAEENEKRLLITGSSDRIPAGGEFMKRVGGRPGLETHVNQLLLAELDHDLLTKWAAIPDGFTPGWWEGAYPQEDIAEIIELNELMNQVPRGDLDVEDFHWTEEHIRQQEKSRAATGTQRWSLYARDTNSGKIAGYTETFWNPNKPMNLGQGITAVWPEYRGRGMGRYLKAAMLEKVLRDRPAVEKVRTDNADINAPMLKINTELGFKPYIAETLWQADVKAAREYVGDGQKG